LFKNDALMMAKRGTRVNRHLEQSGEKILSTQDVRGAA
jgi:hypothetical protein